MFVSGTVFLIAPPPSLLFFRPKTVVQILRTESYGAPLLTDSERPHCIPWKPESRIQIHWVTNEDTDISAGLFFFTCIQGWSTINLTGASNCCRLKSSRRLVNTLKRGSCIGRQLRSLACGWFPEVSGRPRAWLCILLALCLNTDPLNSIVWVYRWSVSRVYQMNGPTFTSG